MRWWKIAAVAVVLAGGVWLVRFVTTPPPGRQISDQGREHVTAEKVVSFQYNSNPPTSGPHLATWVKAGVYNTPQSEGELIHSLEHGYVIISYNCNVHLRENSKSQILNPKQIQNSNLKTQNVFAHEDEGSPSAAFTDPTIATGSAVNESEGCKVLAKQLTELANKKKLWKLIVVPRPELDTTIALSAWTYVDTLDQFDEKRITRFIDYHRDQGPEKTME